MGVEILAAEQWLTVVLGSDAFLQHLVEERIYTHVVPEGTAYPYIWITNQAYADVMGIGPARIMTKGVYTIRGVQVTGSFVDLEEIADRIDIAIHAAYGTVVRGEILACVRERPYALVDPAKGVQYRELGGIYRLWVQ